MCFESDIVYSTKEIKYIHIYNSRLDDFSVASTYGPDGRLDLIVMKDYIKKYEELWICNTYNKYEPFIHVCEYMQRNDFSNPQMYFKEIFSYLDGFIDIYLSDKDKGISDDNDPKYEKLKSDILDCVNSYDFEVCEKKRIIDNIEMIFDNTIRKSLKVLLGKNRLFKLDKKAIEKIVESLINTRNKLFHSPNELFYKKNENYKYLDNDRLVFAVIFLREILINLIYVEVSNQLTCMPLEFVRKGQAGMVERNFLNF